MSGAIHYEFHPHNAMDVAKRIVKRAIENFKNRGKTNIPKDVMEFVAGFSHETIIYILGGRFRGSYWTLNDNIINGRIRGVVAIVGCSNPRIANDAVHTTLTRELIRENVLVLQTGCAAIASAKAGLLLPEAKDEAGPGLREVCEALGIPPALHCGACVDNSRLLVAASHMCAAGGLGDDPAQLPIAGCAPGYMSEKALAIGHYFVSTGLLIVFGMTFPILGSEAAKNFLFKEIQSITGGRWAFETDPMKMARLIIDHIDKKRAALGIDKPRERVLYDMEMRRELKF
jgi:carbon-monoxide dehydrogenase catalytic subunit